MNTDNAKDFLQPQGSTAFWLGARATLPLIVGAIPFGILFGTLGQASDLSLWTVMAMSLIVYAGAAQFIAIGLIAAGAGPVIVVLTTLVVNLRHLLYSAAMVDQVRDLPQGWRALMAFGLTDETFAATSDFRRSQPDPLSLRNFYLGSMVAMYGNWQLCTWVGISLGEAFPDMTDWGLDFAMSVTFIGMVAPYLRNRPMWLCLSVAAVLSVVTWDWPHKLGLMVSALAAICVGYGALMMQRNHQGATHG